MSILIIGGGEIGQYLADQLIAENKSVVIVEKSERVIDEIEESLDAKFILGNGAAPQVLREAGLNDAEMVIAVTDSDEVNMLASIFAGIQAPLAKRIARIRAMEFDMEGEKLKDALNLDLLINPDKVAAKTIEHILAVPGAFEILDFFDGTLQIIGAQVKKESRLIGKKFHEMEQLKEDHHFLIAGITSKGQFIVPSGQSQISEGDNIFFVAKKGFAQKGMLHLGYKKEKLDNVMINGASFIGLNLASDLEKQGINVKLIEPDTQICSHASRSLNKAVLLHATGTDQEFLEQENIHKMDVFVSVTKDDEENIISSLLAKRLGCPVAIALSHKTAYLPLISSMGIDVVINPRQLTKNAIMHFLRRGKVLNVSQLSESAEIVELEALETSDIVDTPIHKIKFPDQVLVISIKRGDEIIVPWGDTIIRPGDRVLILIRKELVSKLEKFISVKLEYF